MYRERLFHKRCNVSYPLSCYRRSTEPQGEHGDSTVVLSVLERGNPKPFKEMTKPCVVKLDETPTNLAGPVRHFPAPFSELSLH
jgi:hypothetical protein